MNARAADDLFTYYERELRYLRAESSAFAARHVHAAARLALSGHESPDPHVERLIESFAFLTGRIQRRLDQDRAFLPAALIEQIYPQLAAPLPSLAIVEAVLDPAQIAPPGVTRPAGASLYARAPSRSGEVFECRFRTCWPWPLSPVVGGALNWVRREDHSVLTGRADVAGVLKVRLSTVGRADFATLGAPRLRFYLEADPLIAGALYERLANDVIALAAVDPDGHLLGPEMSGACLRPIGLDEAGAVLPPDSRLPAAERLMLEYFHYPRKFLFFELAAPAPWRAGREADLLILTRRPPPEDSSTGKARLVTNCVPALNLFPRVSEPIRIDRKSGEYLLSIDSRRARSTEVHSVLSVSAVADPGDEARRLRPYFANRHGPEDLAAPLYWGARRGPAADGGPGSDLWISFVDRAFGPTTPEAPVAFAHTLCTNRGLAEQLGQGAALEIEENLPVLGLRCLERPSAQVAPPLSEEALWRLVSLTTLNRLPLAGGAAGLDALRESVALWGHGCEAEALTQAAAIRRVDARPATRRVVTEFGDGFLRGLAIELELDTDAFVGRNPLLFASVLERFLALQASVNSFTQVDLSASGANDARNAGGGPWVSFPARVGPRHIL